MTVNIDGTLLNYILIILGVYLLFVALRFPSLRTIFKALTRKWRPDCYGDLMGGSVYAERGCNTCPDEDGCSELTKENGKCEKK